ncbi:kunitz-type protease inhibitor 2 [Scomber scombrus]|uniref:kunitz-type protease inhibitor 2 n=1 Tax=Scomber scombrus TaxID=13677 RepID=UPI002DDC7AEA|nr:kunitz-type protease inhibitor 2 [Scomber scombrus]
MQLCVFVLSVCVLLCPGVAQDCSWDRSTEPRQSLDPASLRAGAVHLTGSSDVSDPDSCRASCCAEPACDLALVGFPMDGAPQCTLVSCGKHRDACVLRPDTQFKVYRKKQESETSRDAPQAGESLHIEPLLGETRSNHTDHVRCRLPMRVGLCRASFPKFYYDVTNQSCRRFVYGGCGANGNNFDSQEECEAACSGVTGSVLPDESSPAPPGVPVKSPRMAPAFSSDVAQESAAPAETKPTETQHAEKKEMQADEFAELCGAEPVVGPCRAAFQRWFYSSKTGGCQSFVYGGCQGNKNNYKNQESCMSTCATVNVLPSKKASSDEPAGTESTEHCLAPRDSGPCRAAFPAFYYNTDTGSCLPFLYGGCQGNGNRFATADECMASCSGEGSFEGRGRTRNRWTAAFFLFVTLAAISALLLTTLVVITLRRHGLSRRPSSVSDKEELLQDPDEQSSVESLTVPESPKLEKA